MATGLKAKTNQQKEFAWFKLAILDLDISAIKRTRHDSLRKRLSMT
jgi:hypothetical protein